MNLRHTAVRTLCAVTARPSLTPLWSKVSLAARYFEGLGSGSNIRRSGELAIVDFFARSTLPRTFVDVGANVGDYTDAVVRAVPSVQVLAFEAAPWTAEFLAERFRSSPNVTVVPLGLSDAEETRTIRSPKLGSGEATFYEHLGEEIERFDSIRCITLDRYCAANGIGSIGLMKVDVEGHELAVLKGATDLLRAGAIKAIQFDGGAAFASRVFFRDYWSLLTGHGYRIHRVLPFGLAPIQEYRERDETCLPTIYLATRA